MVKKDVKWSLSGVDYMVRNVPIIEIEEEELLDTNTSIILLTLKDLMVENKLPHDVNYDNYKGIEF